MDPYGPNWTYLDPPGPTRTYLDLPGPTRTYLDLQGPSRTYLDISRPTRAYMDLPEPTWTNQDLLGPTRTYLDLPGPTWIYQDPPRPTWTHHIPQGFSCFLLKPYIKAVTHFLEFEWWRSLMVECVSVFFDYFILHQILCCKWGFMLSLPITGPCINMIYTPSGPLNLILVIQMDWTFHFYDC